QSWNPPGAGTYYWRAVYAGNAANETVSGECNDTNEVTTVTKAEPAITTTATGSVPVGGSVQDVAHLTGLFSTPAPGDVTFTSYSDADCTAAVATVAGVTVTAAGTNAWDVTSAAVAVGTAGSYRWIASYSGDANNVAVAGACGDPGETSIVTKLSPAILTAAVGTVEVGGAATDTASLTGILAGTTVTPAQVTFTIYADNACGSVLGTVLGDTATLVGNVWQVQSKPFTAAHAGMLFWRAAYAGDANNAPAVGGCSDAGEQTTVTLRAPGISTSTAPTAVVGAAVTDVANLTGIFGPVAAGDVHFVLYGDSSCTVVEGSTDGVNVTGGNGTWAVTSGPVTPAHAGTYHWIATYLGNADNDLVAGTCSDADETVIVTARQPALATTATASAPVGAAIHDVATLTGVFGPVTASEVHFALYFGADCTGNAITVATASVSSAGSTWTVTSADFLPAAAGSYHWIASYDGNGDNDPVAGTCGDAGENTTVTRLAPSIATTATSGVAVGGSINDTATLSGTYSGTTVLATQVHFALYGDAKCANLVTTLGTVSLVQVPAGWIAASASYPTTAAGSYRWIASYDGDANNASVTGKCGDPGEASEVGQRAPGITTVAQTPVTVGSTVTDTATITDVFGPVVPADVTFTVYDNADCTGGGAAVPGATLVAPQSGETWVIRSAPFTTTHAQTYYWVASWPGNANNAAVTGACSDPNEQSTATKAQPTIDTAAVQAVTVGTDISDTAHVTGVFGPLTASQVTFDLYVGAECPGTFVSTVAAASATMTGGVWVVTSEPFTTAQAGTYHWVAHYAGNADNAPADGGCGDDGETSTVGKASPAIDTTADATAAIGAAITDTARLTGLAAGTTVAPAAVSFAVYSNATCSTQVGTVSGATVTVGVGQVFVQSAPFTPAAVGTYYWIATYTGDANNTSAAGACGDAGESTVVTARTPAIATTATAQTGLGGAISDTATLDGLFGSPPQGTVTFTLYATADCSGDPLFTGSDRPLVAGAGGTWTATSGAFTPAAAGTYRWIATYTGDAANAAATGACNDAGETSQVGDLVVVKAVDLTVANYGDLLTYTLTGTAHRLDQHYVVITDIVPVGTTYVSAACALPCVTSYDQATKTVTWAVGTVTAESSVAVTFVVRIDRPAAGPDGELPATIIDNIGAIRSTETPTKPSNPVVTHVPKVLGVTVVRPVTHPRPARLATTGPSVPLVPAISVALVMLATGLVLTLSGRRRKETA
ncbi:MAG: DUF11 domain-containing protein, partial [Actinomycetota bacterium]|nr:DUF11 domain-containing protein [Actinomycetota bacterium]